MAFDREGLLKKIKALAAMANPENGGTQGELENAAKLMQKLMDQYNISMLEVMQEQKDDPKFFTSQQVSYKVGTLKQWHWSLARAIDRVVGTRHYSTGGWGVGSREKGDTSKKKKTRLSVMTFFGAENNVAVACELYDKWCERIDRMATTAVQEYIAELESREDIQWEMKIRGLKQIRFIPNLGSRHPQVWRTSWLDGCVSGIHTALWEAEKARDQQTVKIKRKTTQPAVTLTLDSVVSPADLDDALNVEEEEVEVNVGSAMVLYNAELNKAYADLSKSFRTVRTSGTGRSNYDAYGKGQAVGRKINLTSKELKG